MKRMSIVAALIGVALPGLLLYTPKQTPLFLLFVGRLHPLVLHFPIVLALVALGTEVLRRFVFTRIPVTATVVLLAVASLSSLPTIIAGYFLYASGEFSGDVILGHFRGGVMAGSSLWLALATLLYFNQTGRLYWVFFSLLAVANVMISYASHLGGTVTHGQAYLTEHLSMMRHGSVAITAKRDEDLTLYADMVAPILEARCVSCHNPQRTKGSLRLDVYQELFGQGDSDKPAVVRGSISESELIRRILLPDADDEHMPPEGKAPVTADELSVLKFWIRAAGASDTSRVWAHRGNDSIAPVLERLVPELQRYQMRTAFAKAREATVRDELMQLAPRLHLVAAPDSTSEEGLMRLATIVPPHTVSSEDLRLLAPYYPYLSSVSLVSAGVDDDMLYHISEMANVKTLFLQKNDIDGSGLVFLSKMPNLEVLNLSFTRVDDRNALELLKLPALKKVYLFRTNVSRDVVKAIMRYRPDLEVLEEEGPYDIL